MVFPYELLAVPENADDDAIRRAYQKKLRQWPPETHPELFQSVSDAYAAIKDANARAKLKLFGTVPTGSDAKLADLVVKDFGARRKLGVAAWLEIGKEDAR